MDTRATYHRRLAKSSQREKRLMALAVMGVAAGVAGVLLPSPGIDWQRFGDEATGIVSGAGTARPAAPSASGATPPAARQAAVVRRIYRHSVVPGGVADKVELAQVLRTDRLVAAHYAGFNVENARAVTVTTPRAVYVSYRKNDQIYWTSKKVMLEQGETLLTDGEHDIRARCANRISDVPQYPVEHHGPSEAELDTVVAGAAGEDEGGMLAVAAGMDGVVDEGTGQRYMTTTFANGAGLAMLADAAPARTREPGPASRTPGWHNTPFAYRGVLGDGSGTGGGAGSSGATPAVGSNETAGADTGTGTVVAPGGTGGSGGTGSTGGNPDGSTGGNAGGNTGGNPGGNTGGNPGGNTGGSPGDSGGGTSEQPVTPTPTVPTPALPTPGAGTDTPVITPGTPSKPGDTVVDPVVPAEIPEPSTLWLGAIALVAMGWLRRTGARARR